MKILIIGADSLIGRRVIKLLTNREDEVVVLTDNISVTSKLIGGVHNIEYYNIFDQISSNTKIDCIINLEGEKLAQEKWTNTNVKELIYLCKDKTNKIITLINRLKYKPKKLINASAISWYGNNPLGIKIDETFNNPDLTFTHKLYQEWENEAFKMLSCNIQVKIMRFGIILTKVEGLIKKLSPLFKHNLGFYFGKGKQYMSWIHINDVIKAVLFLLDNDTKYSIYNFTSPFPVTNKEFSELLAGKFQAKLFFRFPNFFTYFLLSDKEKELLLNNLQVIPNHLIEEGFVFEYPNLKTAIKNLT